MKDKKDQKAEAKKKKDQEKKLSNAQQWGKSQTQPN
jgi:hypothetical protein